MKLRKVTAENIWKITQLTVAEGQKDFVASNTESLLEAYLAVVSGNIAVPFGIYNDDHLVGFVMFGYGKTGDEDEPDVAAGNYCLWRFMIDKDWQRQGLGKKALLLSLDFLKTFPCGPAEGCWLSYDPENTVARALYHSAGFAENGELCGEEIVAFLHF